ncbi:MAG: hypothetical protein J6S76_01760 [Clostridia bacterium]|nr:hypothetical protein [Clostridia bacterium]
MKISEISKLLDAQILTGEDASDREITSACCSDMMSDVLAYVKDQGMLLTGLVNSQVIRTANMMDMHCIVFVRSKNPTEEMLELAQECGIVVMRSSLRAYVACGKLWMAGLTQDTEDCDV